jgi:hypothetical protein
MKSITRIATVAAALALVVGAPTFASEDVSMESKSCKDAAPACSCEKRQPSGANVEKERERPGTPEFPLFTDQG